MACPLRLGAFKRTMDGSQWVHMVWFQLTNTLICCKAGYLTPSVASSCAIGYKCSQMHSRCTMTNRCPPIMPSAVGMLIGRGRFGCAEHIQHRVAAD